MPAYWTEQASALSAQTATMATNHQCRKQLSCHFLSCVLQICSIALCLVTCQANSATRLSFHVYLFTLACVKLQISFHSTLFWSIQTTVTCQQYPFSGVPDTHTREGKSTSDYFNLRIRKDWLKRVTSSNNVGRYWKKLVNQ